MNIRLISPLEKIFEDQKDFPEMTKGSCLKNERYHFQAVVFSEEDAEQAEITVESDLKEWIAVRRVKELVGAYRYIENQDDYFISDEKIKMYPELLWPAEEDGKIQAGKNAVYWVTVHCKDGLPPGNHKVTVGCKINQKKLKAVFQLEVVDCCLAENTLHLTNWMHYDSIFYTYHTELFSEQFYRVFENILKNYTDHGETMLLIPLFTPPLDMAVGAERLTAQLVDGYVENGKYRFDLSKLDYFLKFIHKRGIRYFEFSHLFTQWGAEACPKIMAEVDGKPKRIFGWDVKADSEEYRTFLQEFFSVFTAYLKKEGYWEMSFIHLSDEPKKTNIEQYRKLSEFLKENISDLKRIDALSNYEYYQENLVDIPIVGLGHTAPFEESGARFWVYYCCSMYRNYVSNRFFQMPSQRNRILGMQLYVNGVDGFIHWGYNFYNSRLSKAQINPYEITDAKKTEEDVGFTSGDCFIVYPYKDTVLDSLRHEVFFDGIQDYLALKRLEEYVGREQVIKMVKEEGVSGFQTYPRSSGWHLAFREKINKKIKEKVEEMKHG